jgi:hypothetical protein
MLEHLIEFEPEVIDHSGKTTPLEKEHPADVIDAKVNTVEWLKGLGAADTDTVVNQAEVQAARASFTNLISSAPAEITHEHLTQIKTPAAVQHLVGMLTAYDWEFVQQAKELRGYTVAKLLEECENPNANIRLKALGLLGKVTEVGLFTDKIEVKKTDLTDEEIDKKLKDKLAAFMGVQDMDVVEDIEINEPSNETQQPDAQPD